MWLSEVKPEMRHIIDDGRIYHCGCGDATAHGEAHARGEARLGVDWVVHGVTEWIIHDIDNHDGQDVPVEATLRFYHARGFPVSAFRSRRGGVHVYMRLTEPVSVGDANAWSRRLATALAREIGRRCDVFPATGRCIFVEGFGGVDNGIVRSEARIEPRVVASVVLALPGPASQDMSRSGHDFRFIARLLREAPWNVDKTIRDAYVAHTVGKLLPEVYDLSRMQDVQSPPVVLSVPTDDGRVRLRPGLAVVTGPPGSGKSTFVWRHMPDDALIIGTEYDVVGAYALWRKWAPDRMLRFAHAGTAAQVAWLMDSYDASVYALDSVQSFTDDLDELDAFVRWLKYFADTRGKLVVAIAHENSGMGRAPIHRIQGSLRLRQLSDVVLLVDAPPGMPALRRVTVLKDRWGFIDDELSSGKEDDHAVGRLL